MNKTLVSGIIFLIIGLSFTVLHFIPFLDKIFLVRNPLRPFVPRADLVVGLISLAIGLFLCFLSIFVSL